MSCTNLQPTTCELPNMVSTNQAGSGKEWGTKEERFIESSMDIVPLLRGVRTDEERRAWVGAMNRSGRDFPVEYYELVTE